MVLARKLPYCLNELEFSTFHPSHATDYPAAKWEREERNYSVERILPYTILQQLCIIPTIFLLSNAPPQ